LSDFGVNQIKSLTLDIPRKKRKKVVPIADMEAGILAAIESVVSGGGMKFRIVKILLGITCLQVIFSPI